MKMRKLFAGLAAAATLLGGMAFGAGTANAASRVIDTDVVFQFMADDADQWANREVKYYKLADYVDYTTSGPFGVQTTQTANKTAIKSALDAAVKGTKLDGQVPSADSGTDLMAWALQQGALDSESTPWTGSTRKFADALAADAKVTGDATNFTTITWPTYQGGTSQEGHGYKNRWVRLPAGVYLFVDTVKNTDVNDQGSSKSTIQNGTEQNSGDVDNTVGGKVVTQSAPIVLASGYVKDGQIKNWAQPEDGTGFNTIDFKNHVTPVIKTYDDKDGTVSSSQYVRYTLGSQLPSFTTGFTDYQFSLKDYPGAGQEVNLNGFLGDDGQPVESNTGAYTVKIYDVDANGGKTGDGTTLTAGDATFTVTTSTTQQGQQLNPVVAGAADDAAWFDFDFAKLVQSADYQTKYAGKYVEITYAAKITATPDQNGDTPAVTNKVEVNDNNAKATDQTKLTLGKFGFVKKAADGTALAGAEFTISAADDDASDKTVPVTPADAVQTSDKDGKVTFTGLADGVYKVTETRVPDGFLQQVHAEFEVTIKGGKAVYFKHADLYGLSQDSGNADLNGDEITDYSVINVRNVTELPKTGAAGIVLFAVVGLLLAGAAGTVFAKSRATKRALHA
ncbi:SpaA isopeptide-forming pilin-related protein [Bifidobacterium stellenboschense]|uniref:FimA fimbrial subunit-like protein n=1 Tax=Bifidobacterium stellenboschense TaxID=762211 RepID=A0A087DNA0_9BIFI|nr:SpaA isopeptide-forming pilin-related protein [Bifidobacterium stellenboschense]KFI97000.1 FimA fimbrial subunit-like protein [Bifidobacterium stellenboschense]